MRERIIEALDTDFRRGKLLLIQAAKESNAVIKMRKAGSLGECQCYQAGLSASAIGCYDVLFSVDHIRHWCAGQAGRNLDRLHDLTGRLVECVQYRVLTTPSVVDSQK